MSGDYSRFVFDPSLDYDGVLLQQGRPLTDWDWNDQVSQSGRRLRAGTVDTLGQAVVPATTPDGFKIDVTGGKMTIGRGRIYVDGLLAENHGLEPRDSWDPILAENFGAKPVPYAAQIPPNPPPLPYQANPLPLPTSGRYLVYLDVWHREVTRLQAPDLVEPALGVDTTTRLQTVWQVKVIPDVGSAECSTPLDEVPGWIDATAPSAGRLSTDTNATDTDHGPCVIPPDSAYQGLENQLYRVEVHIGGHPGDKATFKWSRDNASLETPVQRLIGLSQLIVETTKKDDILRFSDGDWIEITDDWRELNGQPGELHQIKIGKGVDDATRTITLAKGIAEPATFPVDGNGKPPEDRHMRIRRWDQSGKVLKKDGSQHVDLNDAASTGAIPIPANGTSIVLEAGIVVTFSIAATNGQFRSGDYWVFAARSATGTIEKLVSEPPRGIHHHYARLAVVTSPDHATDCRVVWPPPKDADSCACTVCVTPELHKSGVLPIAKAVDMVQGTGGIVCLMPGQYTLDKAVTITGPNGVRVVGRGTSTRIISSGQAFDVTSAKDVLLADFSITAGGTAVKAPFVAVKATDADGLVLERLALSVTGPKGTAALALGGKRTTVTLRDSQIVSPVGVTCVAAQSSSPQTKVTSRLELRADGNALTCSEHGIAAQSNASCTWVVELRDNRITGTADAVQLEGLSASGSVVDIVSNTLVSQANGVSASFGRFRLDSNEIIHSGTNGSGSGILLADPDGTPGPARDFRIVGNRITGFGGSGIRSNITAARMIIAQNQIEKVGHGIVMGRAAQVQALAVDGNQIADADTSGIWIENAISVQVDGNSIRRVGAASSSNVVRTGVLVGTGTRISITRNEITAVGPSDSFGGSAYGIVVSEPFSCATVSGNVVRRPWSDETDPDGSDWQALFVGTLPSRGKQSLPLEEVSESLSADRPVLGFQVAKEAKLAAKAPVVSEGNVAPAPQSPGAEPAAAAGPSVPKPERVLVQGNEFDGAGRNAMTIVKTTGDCVFTGNHCIQRFDATCARVEAMSLIFSNNRMRAGDGHDALKAASSGEKKGAPKFTALGNITNGAIDIEGVKFKETPWFPLNVIEA